MAFDITSIQQGKRNLPPRILLLGTPKVGKTEFCCVEDRATMKCMDDVILLPIKGEEGSDALDVGRFPIIQTFEQIMEAFSVLSMQDHPYSTVVIDSSSALEPLVWDKACRENSWTSIEKPGYGKGYVEALKYWRQIQECLDYLRNERKMACVIIGHVVVKVFNDPMMDPYDQFIWNINSKAVGLFTQWADCVLFAKHESFSKIDKDGNSKVRRGTGAGLRKLYTQERPAHPGGGRGIYGRLPYELDLSWTAFTTAVNATQ